MEKLQVSLKFLDDGQGSDISEVYSIAHPTKDYVIGFSKIAKYASAFEIVNDLWRPRQMLFNVKEIHFIPKWNILFVKSSDPNSQGFDVYEYTPEEGFKNRGILNLPNLKSLADLKLAKFPGYNNNEYGLIQVIGNLAYFKKINLDTLQISDSNVPAMVVEMKKLYIDNIDGNDKDEVILSGQNGIDLYRIADGKNFMNLIMNVPHCQLKTLREKLYFAKLDASNEFEHLLCLNSTGLFTFEYAKDQNNYQFVNHNKFFSKVNGWSETMDDTIKFEHILFDKEFKSDTESMIFTGPQGLMIFNYDKFKNEWISNLQNGYMSVQQRYSEFKAIHFQNKERIHFFTKRKNMFYDSLLETHTKAETKRAIKLLKPRILQTPKFEKIFKEESREYDDETKPYYYLSDRFKNFQSLINPIDRNTGKPKFSIPLIEFAHPLKNFQFELIYDASNYQSHLCGMGWSLQSNNNFILFYHEFSVLQEDQKIFIILENKRRQLIKTSEDTSKRLEYYKMLKDNFEDDENPFIKDNSMEIKYDWENQEWTITNKGITQIYGHNDKGNNVIYEGRGIYDHWIETRHIYDDLYDNHNNHKAIPITWYLREIKDNYSNWIKINYGIHSDNVIQGRKYLTEVFLRSIQGSNGNHLKFMYNKNKLISGYDFVTNAYRQKTFFKYDFYDEKPFLIGIYENDRSSKGSEYNCQKKLTTNPKLQQYCFEFLKFDYIKLENNILEGLNNTNVKYLINQITLPNDAKVKMEYNELRPDNYNECRLEHTNFVGEYKFWQGNNFYVFAYLDPYHQHGHSHLFVEIYDFGISEQKKSPKATFDFYTENFRLTFKTFEILQFNDNIGILGRTDDFEVFYIIKRDNVWNSEWKHVKTFKFMGTTQMKIGQDFFLTTKRVAESSHFYAEKIYTVQLIFKDEKTNEWKHKNVFDVDDSSNFPPTDEDPYIISSTINKYMVHDARKRSLHLSYRDYKNKWNLKEITNWQADIVTNIRKTSDYLKRKLNINPEHFMYKSIGDYYRSFALQFNKNLVLMTYPVVHEDTNMIYQNVYSFLFDKNYKVIKEFRQEFLIAEIDENTKVEGLLKRCSVMLQVETITVNDKHIIFDGNDWLLNEPKQSSQELTLGEEYVIKQNGDFYALFPTHGKYFKPQEDNYNLQSTTLDQLIIRYPNYMAYRLNPGQIRLVVFEKIYQLQLTLAGNDRDLSISPFSTSRLLIAKNRGALKVVENIHSRVQTQIVTSRTIQLEDKLMRNTSYLYDWSTAVVFNDKLFFTNVNLIPGGEKEKFGLIQTSHPNLKKYFDANGRLVKVVNGQKVNVEKVNEKSKGVTGEDVNEEEYKLYDVTRALEIVDFSPYKISDDECAYFGFEDYEQRNHQLDSKLPKWIFNEANIVKNKFSLTGKNYLQLSNNDSIKAEFLPKQQNQTYVFSSWIRLQHQQQQGEKKIQVGSIIENMMIKVSAFDDRGTEVIMSHVLSEVKRIADEWIYLESIVDFAMVNQLKQQKQIKGDSRVTLVITKADVDHVKFNTLQANYKSYVYDPRSKHITEIIYSNGLFERYIYDKYGQVVTIIDVNNHMQEIFTYTKYDAITLNLNQNDETTMPLMSKIQIITDTGFFEKFTQNSISKNWLIKGDGKFTISPALLRHLSGCDLLQLNRKEIDNKSFGLRFLYEFSEGEEGSIKLFEDNDIPIKIAHKVSTNKGEFTFLKPTAIDSDKIPLKSEVLIIVEDNEIFIWIGGHLKTERHLTSLNPSSFVLKICGKVYVSDLMVFSKPNVFVTYLNKMNEKVQEIILKNKDEAVVTEYLYDELGRQLITTNPVAIKKSKLNHDLLGYHSNLISNANPNHMKSVWKTGKLSGTIPNQYDFTERIYPNNIVEEKEQLVLPGQLAKFYKDNKIYSSDVQNQILNELYPLEKGYYYHVQRYSTNVYDISIFDLNEKRVARFLNIEESEDSSKLCTYEYNDEGNLIRVLPPNYHEIAGTLKTRNQLSSGEIENKMAYNYEYNNQGKMILKTNADATQVKLLYDDSGKILRYMVIYKKDNKEIEKVLYFDYNSLGKLQQTGELMNFNQNQHFLCLLRNSNDKCSNNVDDKNSIKIYQRFFYNDQEYEATLRGQIKRVVTINNEKPFIEEYLLNNDGETIEKRIITSKTEDGSTSVLTLKTKYTNGQITEIKYPVQVFNKPFTVTYDYNKQGRMVGIGLPEKNSYFARFMYNTDGTVDVEKHLPKTKLGIDFNRKFTYNSFARLTSINDKYLNVEFDYEPFQEIKNIRRHIDGTIMKTRFNATWHTFAKPQIQIYSKIDGINISDCVYKAIKNGRLFESKPKELLYNELKQWSDNYCDWDRINKSPSIIRDKWFPNTYGHQYTYNAEGELKNAKYFEEPEIQPIIPISLYNAEISEIDKNGNLKKFKTGYDDYEINYEQYTNKIKSLSKLNTRGEAKPKLYTILHDNQGNVIQAMHKNIKNILYHSVSGKPIKVEMIDRSHTEFSYDSQGERILKKVFDTNGSLVKEIHYIRDSNGRSMVERQITYSMDSPTAPTYLVTIYIYGPRGLLGFIRQNEYYSVVTDHQGSVRLVVRNGEVVAAYDYLPYGSTMRQFVSFPEANISYRFTGQEYDEEFDLYYYHARLYDPEIGRFLQIDPKETHTSPYKYALNSPLSYIDPDGKEPITIAIAIIGAIIGAYLGGAAANHSWNPLNWNWKNYETYLGIVIGAIAGAAIGTALTNPLAYVGLYIGGAYANNWQFNPLQWDWKDPKTVYGMFNGFSIGGNIVDTFTKAYAAFKGLSLGGKLVFAALAGSQAVFSVTAIGFQYNWDVNNRDMWADMGYSLYESLSSPLALGTGKIFGKVRILKLESVKNNVRYFKLVKSYFGNVMKNLAFVKTAIKLGLFVTLAAAALYKNDFDMTSIVTYNDLLKGLNSAEKDYKFSKIARKSSQELSERLKKMGSLMGDVGKKLYKALEDEVDQVLHIIKSTWFNVVHIHDSNNDVAAIVEFTKQITFTNSPMVFYRQSTSNDKNQEHFAKALSPALLVILRGKLEDSLKTFSTLFTKQFNSALQYAKLDINNPSVNTFKNLLLDLLSNPDKNDRVTIDHVKELSKNLQPHPFYNYFIDKIWDGLTNLIVYTDNGHVQGKILNDHEKLPEFSFSLESGNNLNYLKKLNSYTDVTNLDDVHELKSSDPLWTQELPNIIKEHTGATVFHSRSKRSIQSNKYSVVNSETNNSFVQKNKNYITDNDRNEFYNHTSSHNLQKVDAQVDVNATLSLVDMIVRKVTGQKPINSTANRIVPVYEAQSFSINAVYELEKILRKIAKKNNISKCDIIFDPVSVQSRIYKKYLSENSKAVLEIIETTVKNAFPNSEIPEKHFTCLYEYLESTVLKKKQLISAKSFDKYFSDMCSASVNGNLKTLNVNSRIGSGLTSSSYAGVLE